MNFLIAMDSFKGCLSAKEVCTAVAEGINTAGFGDTACLLPLADGGEGTAECICTALAGEKQSVFTVDPFGKEITAEYAVVNNVQTGNRCAVIDTAAASGLSLARGHGLNPMKASTYGTGCMIRHAIEQGIREIVVGLGGSGTNDCGIGALYALGTRFFDENGCEIRNPSGGYDLSRISDIRLQPLPGVQLTLIFDVAVPLLGTNGAALLFSPQKGADTQTADFLEKAAAQFSSVVFNQTGTDYSQIPGAGAAGGLGFGLSLMGGQLTGGADYILELTGFDKLSQDTDIVITGEGRTDRQTAEGKLPAAVAKAAKTNHKPVFCICGSFEADDRLYACGIDGLFSILPRPMSLEEAIENAPVLLKDCACNLTRTIHAIRT